MHPVNKKMTRNQSSGLVSKSSLEIDICKIPIFSQHTNGAVGEKMSLLGKSVVAMYTAHTSWHIYKECLLNPVDFISFQGLYARNPIKNNYMEVYAKKLIFIFQI